MQDTMNIPYGYCQCGCQKETRIAPRTDKKKGWIKGEPKKYIFKHAAWKGGIKYNKAGYKLIKRRFGTSYHLFHRFIVEQLFGIKLPNHVVVHHSNGNKQDNEFNNFVVCENDSYHKLLHKRKRAYDACGHANWLKCSYCKEYDNPDNLYLYPGRKRACHRKCHTKYQKQWNFNLKLRKERNGKNHKTINQI